MTYNFGKLFFVPRTAEIVTGEDAAGNPIISVINYLELENSEGVSWQDLVSLHPHPYYIAVMDDGTVFSMESDYEASQIASHFLWGIDETYGFTNGTNGTVYGKYWNGSVIAAFPVLPETTKLTTEQFYVMLEDDGKLDAFIDAIETVTPTSKKLTCRNQFNNSAEFSWTMTVVVTVMPIVYGSGWQAAVGPLWVAASAV